MIHECEKTQGSRARKGERYKVISIGSAVRHFKKIATETWWERRDGRLGFFAKTKAFPEGVYVVGNLR